MHKILFVCHGNICRSPMCEFVMKELVRRAGRDAEFVIDSKACRTDEIGSDAHPGTQRMLRAKGIPFSRRAARLIRREDYDAYDFVIAMDDENMRDLHRLRKATPNANAACSCRSQAKSAKWLTRGTRGISRRHIKMP